MPRMGNWASGSAFTVQSITVSNLYAQKINSTSIKIQGGISGGTATSVDMEIHTAGSNFTNTALATKQLTSSTDINAFNGTDDFYTWGSLALADNSNFDYRVRVNGGAWVESLWSGNGGFRTVTDILAGQGNFETDSDANGLADGWAIVGTGGALLDTTWKTYGTKSQKRTAMSANSAQLNYDLTGKIEINTYYVMVVESCKFTASKPESEAVLFNGFINNGVWTNAASAVVAELRDMMYLSESPKTIVHKFKTPSTFNQPKLGTAYSGNIIHAETLDAWIDGVRLYKIDATLYDKIKVDSNFTGTTNLMKKFPFV